MSSSNSKWEGCRIGITGGKGSLGKALKEEFKRRGAIVICFTHSKIEQKELSINNQEEWIQWECGKEYLLDKALSNIDILILNHGVNAKGIQSTEMINKSIEVNALSVWRLIDRFEKVAIHNRQAERLKEIWVNTSEAEIQPALSPLYEISKRLIGQIVSLKFSNLTEEEGKTIKIRKLILGPFKSNLNPIGIMSASFVANQIINQSRLNFYLIIVSPNPLTYLLMPLTELLRFIYFKSLKVKR